MIRRIAIVLGVWVILTPLSLVNVSTRQVFLTLGAAWVLFAMVLAVVLYRWERHP